MTATFRRRSWRGSSSALTLQHGKSRKRTTTENQLHTPKPKLLSRLSVWSVRHKTSGQAPAEPPPAARTAIRSRVPKKFPAAEFSASSIAQLHAEHIRCARLLWQ